MLSQVSQVVTGRKRTAYKDERRLLFSHFSCREVRQLPVTSVTPVTTLIFLAFPSQVSLFSTLVARHRLGPQLFANGVDAGPIGPGAMHGPEAPPTSGIAQVFGFVDGPCKNTLPFDIDDALAVGRTITIVGAA